MKSQGIWKRILSGNPGNSKHCLHGNINRLQTAWDLSRKNLILLQSNNKRASHLAHPCGLISTVAEFSFDSFAGHHVPLGLEFRGH